MDNEWYWPRSYLLPEERKQSHVKLPARTLFPIKTLEELTEIDFEKFCTSEIRFALENDLLARAAQVRYENIQKEAHDEIKDIGRNTWFSPWKVRIIQERAYDHFSRLREKIIQAYTTGTHPYREIMGL